MEFKNQEKQILKKFLYKKNLKYNEIWNKQEIASGHFDYYLKKLINEDIIFKDNHTYKLTTKGNNLIMNLDGKDISIKPKPVTTTFFLVKNNNKYLLCKRNKQPFLGYFGIPGGKVELGKTTYEQALEELKEETNLTGKEGKLKIIAEYITRDVNNNDITHHITAFIYLFEEYEGELKGDKREGDFLWVKSQDLKKYKCFPDLKKNLKIIEENKPEIIHYAYTRKLKNNEIN